MFTNVLQTSGCVICVLAFILTVTSVGSSTDQSPFSLSMQILGLGFYLAIPISSVALAVRNDPGEASLLFSQALTAIGIGLGVIPIILIFQNSTDETLVLFFTSGYLTNIPAFICRTIPRGYIWQQKSRGAPAGDCGNLNGIRIEMQVNKKGQFILHLVFFGIMASFFLSRVALSSPNLIVWFPLVILVSVSIIGLTAYLQGGKTGWQPVILDNGSLCEPGGGRRKSFSGGLPGRRGRRRPGHSKRARRKKRWQGARRCKCNSWRARTARNGW